jgi:hypothetical protein
MHFPVVWAKMANTVPLSPRSGGCCKSPRVMCLGEPAKLSAEQKKQILALLGKRIKVRAKCREVRNSVESAIYEPVVIMQFPDAAPLKDRTVVR